MKDQRELGNIIECQYEFGSEQGVDPKIISSYQVKFLSLCILFFFSLVFTSCKAYNCRKKEERIFSSYKNWDKTHSEYDFHLHFECCHTYTKAYVEKQLGKPKWIFIKDWKNKDSTPDTFEEWIYPLRGGFNTKIRNRIMITALGVLRFDLKSGSLVLDPYCSSCNCRDFLYVDFFGDEDEDGQKYNFWNQENFDYNAHKAARDWLYFDH